MGDYADMTIDNELNAHLDYIHGCGNYEDDYSETTHSKKQLESHDFEFKEIKRETEKAWLLIMSGDAERWFPKNHCVIIGNMITIPDWLFKRILNE